MKVLVAEDDRIARRLLETMLKKWGYDVVIAPDGNDAWCALQSDGAPHLMLLDWMMPGIDGLEICRRIRKSSIPLQPYIILVTAKDRKADIVLGLEAGANDYVSKPYDKSELHARIKVGERVLELQSALSRRVQELQEALAHIKTLQGILPICMYCHKIRNDQQSWDKIEKYIQEHSKAQFSHGICPECLKKHYPDLECVKQEQKKTESSL